jgi:putative ABC transport system ATP-binding protein
MSKINTTKNIINVSGVHRRYELAGQSVHALKGVDFQLAYGEFLSLVGRSGSGKTTLLNIVAGLDRPSEGTTYFKDQDLGSMSDEGLAILRRHHVGIVFQSSALMPLLTAYENVELPLRIQKISRSERDRRVKENLDLVGMIHRANHRPYELSGGEQQRIAIARAIITSPDVILADEPTGELDSITARKIFALFRDLVNERDISIIAATHDRALIDVVDKVVELKDGEIA